MHISEAPKAFGQRVRVSSGDRTWEGNLRGYGDSVTGEMHTYDYEALGVVIDTAAGREVVPLDVVDAVSTSARA